MAKVYIEFKKGNKFITGKAREIATTGDTAYIFHDISNALVNGLGEIEAPKGTTEIVIRIPCEGYKVQTERN